MKFHIQYASGRSEERELNPGKYIVGREAGDIVLGDGNVSARHAELEVLAQQALITDLGSSNGTFEGGARLSAPAVMVAGRPIRLGSSTLTLVQPPAPAAMPQAHVSPARRVPPWRAVLALAAVLGAAGVGWVAWSAAAVAGMPWATAADDYAPGVDADVQGITLGMSEEDAAASCAQRSPEPRVRRIHSGLDEQGKLVSGSSLEGLEARRGKPLDNRFITGMTCGSKAGLTDIAFASPPSAPRVLRVFHTDHHAEGDPSFDTYREALVEKYGPAADELPAQAIPPMQGRFKHALKWLFPRDGMDCQPSDGQEYSAVPLAIDAEGTCATSLVVTAVSINGKVISSELRLLNAAHLREQSQKTRGYLEQERAAAVQARAEQDGLFSLERAQVGELRLGMSRAAVRQALSTRSPPLAVEERGGLVKGSGAGEAIEAEFSGDRALMLIHTRVFEPNSMPAAEYEQALAQAYGPPTEEDPMLRIREWRYPETASNCGLGKLNAERNVGFAPGAGNIGIHPNGCATTLLVYTTTAGSAVTRSVAVLGNVGDILR